MSFEKEWTNTDDKLAVDVHIALIVFELLWTEWNYENKQLKNNLFVKLSQKHLPRTIASYHAKEHDVA